MRGSRLSPIRVEDRRIYVIDQTELPDELTEVELEEGGDACRAISRMQVRGAPLIGITAAFGMFLASREHQTKRFANYEEEMERFARRLSRSRPTAVNLKWAVEKQRVVIRENAMKSPEEITDLLFENARQIWEEDLETGRRIGWLGSVLLPKDARAMTYCNTGALATGGSGTALSVLIEAAGKGRLDKVWVCETRPRLQGAKLTTVELDHAGIDHTLITDNAAGALMNQGRVDVVVVGADRIAANGDVANKIGTYSLAVLADRNGIPFYVAAPRSSFDRDADSGSDIEIEERSANEVRRIGRKQIAPEGTDTLNLAFDVTPSELVDGIITEKGMWESEAVPAKKRASGAE